MATLLARLKIRAGKEALWQSAMTQLVDQTLANEQGVLRYEYWKAQAPRTWYSLLSFVDKNAFFVHQDADYHRSAPFTECIEEIELEFVDPVQGASPLPRTVNTPLAEDAPTNISEWEQISPVQQAEWWADHQ